MTKTRNTPITGLARAALATLVALLGLTVVAPATAHAAGETAGVTPTTAAAGDPVTISGSGFQPGEAVEVHYGGSTIAAGVADANGSFSVSGAIPAGMPEGGHPMDVVGSMGSMVGLSYTVVAPPPPPAAPPASGSGTGSGTGPPSSPATPVASPKTATSTETGEPVDGTDGTEEATATDLDDTGLAVGENAASSDGNGPSTDTRLVLALLVAAGGAGWLAVALVRERERERERARA